MQLRMATIFALLTGGMLVFAQSPNGCLTGAISNEFGVRVEHATVTIRNAETGAEELTRPNSKGEYRVGNLPAGRYSIRAAAAGRTTVQINDILLQENKTVTTNLKLPELRAEKMSVVEVSEAPEPVDTAAPLPAVATPPPASEPRPAPADGSEDAKIMDPKVVVGEIAAIRDRLALSADQQMKIHDIFQQRQAQVLAARQDNTLTMPARRERIKLIRLEADTKFRALLNDNQQDEYEEILRERRERAVQRKLEATTASH